jgi:hypothetical protein
LKNSVIYKNVRLDPTHFILQLRLFHVVRKNENLSKFWSEKTFWRAKGEVGALLDSIFQHLNIMQSFVCIVFESLTVKLHFSTVANIFKISVLDFFLSTTKWGTNRHSNCNKRDCSFLLLKWNFYIIYLLCCTQWNTI